MARFSLIHTYVECENESLPLKSFPNDEEVALGKKSEETSEKCVNELSAKV